MESKDVFNSEGREGWKCEIRWEKSLWWTLNLPRGGSLSPLHVINQDAWMPGTGPGWVISSLLTAPTDPVHILISMLVSSAAALSNMVVTSQTWLFKFNENETKVQFLSCTSHISSAQEPGMANIYMI